MFQGSQKWSLFGGDCQLRLVRLFHPYRCTWPRGHFARCSSFGWRTLFDDASSLGFVQFSHGYHTLHCAGLRSHRLRIMPFTIESPLTGAGHGLWQVDTQLACCGWCSIRFGMRHVVKFFFFFCLEVMFGAFKGSGDAKNATCIICIIRMV